MTDPFPKWARWIAQDSAESGSRIIVCDEKPKPGYELWLTDGKTMIICEGTPNPHWRESLDWLGEDDD